MTTPPSNLSGDLARAAAIKAEMTQLLARLEQQATGRPVATPGGWRHHPAVWAAKNLARPGKPQA